VITVGMFTKIRRMHFREQPSIREIERRTNLSRNTIRKWLREPAITEPRYPERQAKSVVDAYADQIRSWIQTDSHCAKRGRRTARVMFQAIQVQGCSGGYGRVCALVRRLQQELVQAPSRKAFIPLAFAHGEVTCYPRLLLVFLVVVEREPLPAGE
jgi:transposase